jgi:hypothetical protein
MYLSINTLILDITSIKKEKINKKVSTIIIKIQNKSKIKNRKASPRPPKPA